MVAKLMYGKKLFTVATCITVLISELFTALSIDRLDLIVSYILVYAMYDTSLNCVFVHTLRSSLSRFNWSWNSKV